MLPLKDLLLLTLWLVSGGANAQKGQINSNLTVAFFPGSEEATCEEAKIAGAITLTTDTVPTNFVCFNLTDLFSRPSDSGTQNGSRPSQSEPYQGVDYLLSNRGSYNADTNYTNVFYRQVNQTTTTAKPGEAGTWVFYTYAFENCIQNGGDDYEYNDWPWFETSCQTKNEGECRQLPKPIRSFAIGPASTYNARHGKCEVWAQMGVAGGVSASIPHTAVLLVVAAAMAAMLML